jgi:P-type E1-E2 ATPase
MLPISTNARIDVGPGKCPAGEDALRPEAVQAVAALRTLRRRTVQTGDTEAIALTVGKRLRLDEVHAELLPDEKVAKIKGLLAAGKRVAMVGDGINDAPALTEASVGVAMESGTDVARESADVVLLGNDLLKFVETVQVARRCRRIISSGSTSPGRWRWTASACAWRRSGC